MKKSLLLAAAALFAASSSFAATWTVVGADVNGESWNPGATKNDMKETSSGVYELDCATLGREFKIVPDHDWANGLCSSGSEVTLGTPYAYQQVADGGDNLVLAIANNEYLTSAKVVLNTTDAKITVTGTIAEKEPVDPSLITYYIIGDNVNGQSWTESAEDAKFEDKGNGIYEWRGEILGTGFKINDGTWSNDDINFGSNGSEMTLGVPYYYAVGGGTKNIAFSDGATEVLNPVVTLDTNEQTLTVEGEAAGESAWYIMGINGVWNFEEAADYQLLPVEGEEGVFANVITVYETVGTFKISDTGWIHELGTNAEDFAINADNMSMTLDDVESNTGDVPYELEEGQYKVTFDYNEYELTFSKDNGVDEVVVSLNGKVEYYNLHGQKVANPDKGIYIQVVNGKALKVVK